MRNRSGLTMQVFASAWLLLFMPPHSAKTAGSDSQDQPADVIACRLMEVHTSPELQVSMVVFHQQDKKDGPRLAALLNQHSGETFEFQAASDGWHRARVFRLKSCFGRGLLIFPAAAATLREKTEFQLRLPNPAPQ